MIGAIGSATLTLMSDERLSAQALDAVTDAALSAAERLGCDVASLRVERIRNQYVALRDGAVEGAVDDEEFGIGLRVVHGGSMGFAATVAGGADAAAGLAARAVEAARVAARAGGPPAELAAEPSYGSVEWTAPYRLDPIAVPFAEKADLLRDWSGRLLGSPRIDHVSATLSAAAEEKYYADLSGTRARQHRVRVHPVVEAVAIDSPSGAFETLRTCAPPVGRGYEYLVGDGWDFDAELAEMPELLAEKLAAPSVEPGRYDLVLDPTHLWLTIHESVGHATELDRALGYEAAYAGTSFASFDKLGSLRYGSDMMHIVGDRTTPYGLATVGYDDEGVEAQSFDIVRDGVLVGFQLDRRIAAEAGFARSNGCAFADSPLHIPIQRMANVSLEPAPGVGPSTQDLIAGVERGIYIVGDKSWSIDQQRYNFQFTGQRCFKIDHGRLVGQLRDVAYQSITTEFWASLAALGGRSTYLLAGATNCGKGQPGQGAPVSHGCPSTLFRDVAVLNTRQESGR